MRRAFTLLELLVVVAIMGIMVAAGVMSVTAGQGAARVKGAVRDVFAAIRHARSTALVTKQPAVITYSTAKVDGEVVARVEVHTTKLLDTTDDGGKVETLTGEPIEGEEEESAPAAQTEKSSSAKTANGDGASADAAAEGQGEAIEDILFAPLDDSVVKGMRLKVVMGQELVETVVETRKPKISVFSNVDYLLNKFKSAKESAAESATAKTTTTASETKTEEAEAVGEDQEPVSLVWDTNGRIEPHQVWVYPDGKKPEDGMLIRIDRFGAVKVLSGNGKEED